METDTTSLIIRDLPDRRISKAACEKYGVSVGVTDGVITTHRYPYANEAGHLIAAKHRRCADKEFWWDGSVKDSTLFGQQLFPPGSSKFLTIVEGELDALAAYDMNGRQFPVVSVKNGAQGAVDDCAKNYEYINSFDNIVICFDKDEGKVSPNGEVRYPGQEAALKVANLFPPKKVRVLTLQQAKDAGEYLIKGLTAEFTREWWRAPVFTPDGLKLGRDMWEEISAPKNYETVLYPWDSLNKMTYGMRLSEAALITAETGIGKTSVLKEIEYHLLNDPETKARGYGIGMLHLEEPNADSALGLMSIAANKPLHLPDVREKVTPDELRGYFDSTVNTDRVVIWDHFGSNSVHEVLAKIRHMHVLGCKYIILDHLSIVVSDQSGDERKQLDEISTKLKTLCMELNIFVLAVIHLNREGQIRGSAGPEQLANIIMRLKRDKEDVDEWRRNVTKIEVTKNRFCGRTGPGGYLWYNPTTGRLTELTQEEIAKYESGTSVAPEEQW